MSRFEMEMSSPVPGSQLPPLWSPIGKKCLLLHLGAMSVCSPYTSNPFFVASVLHYLTTIVVVSEKAMAPHSSTLAWKIPWMEEPGGLQSMGPQRLGHD